MEPSDVQIIKAQLMAMKETLHAVAESSKKQNVGITTANDFHGLLKRIADKYPKVKDILPEKIPHNQFLMRAGLAAATFIDLEVKVNQLIKIIELLESEQ